MGAIGRALSAVATGGLSEVARQVLPQDTYNTVSSIASGGISDIIERNQAPFTGALGGIGAPKEVLDINQYANDIINPVTRGGRILVNMAENDVGGWEGFDQLLDTPNIGSYSRGTDQGAIDFGTRVAGDLLYDVAPEVSAYAQPIGSTVGGIVGSYVPVIGTAAGAAIGSGIGSKIGAGNREEDYGKDFINAGISYGAGAATKGLGKYVGNAASKAGIQGGKVIGGAVQGAARGALGAAPSAYEQGSLKPIAIGAGVGGAAGGITGAYNMYKGEPLVYGSEEFENSPFETDYKLDPNTGEYVLDKAELYALEDNPQAYGSKEFFQKALDLGIEPMQALDLDDTSLGGVSANELAKSDMGLWDKTKDLMKNAGDAILRSNLGKIGQQMMLPQYIGDSTSDESRQGSSTNEESVDTLLTRMRGAESAKKSKKAGYVEVLNPETGMPFLLQDLGGYKEGEVPEQRLYT